MKRPLHPLAGALLLLFVISLPTAAQGGLLENRVDDSDVRRQARRQIGQAIDAREAEWKAVWERDDAARLASFYGRDATLELPDGTVLAGRTAIQEHFARILMEHVQVQTSPTGLDLQESLTDAMDTRTISYRVETPAGPALFTGTKKTVLSKRWASDPWTIEYQVIAGAVDSTDAARAALTTRRGDVDTAPPPPFVPAASAVTISVGTLGIGVELARMLGHHLRLRAGYHGLSSIPEFEWTAQLNSYGISSRLQNYTGWVDVYPVPRAGFHLTGGIVGNLSEMRAVAERKADGYVLNGKIYGASEVGELSAILTFPRHAPYLGIGYRPLNPGLGFEALADIGVALGGPTVALTTSGSPGTETGAAIEAERAALQREADRIPFYPVFTWSLVYRF